MGGCYSWLVGGAFSLLEAVGGEGPVHHRTDEEGVEDWDDVDGK